jgi:hypothetical protein
MVSDKARPRGKKHNYSIKEESNIITEYSSSIDYYDNDFSEYISKIKNGLTISTIPRFTHIRPI